MTPEEKKAYKAKLLGETREQFGQGLEAERKKHEGKTPAKPAAGETIDDVHPDRMDD